MNTGLNLSDISVLLCCDIKMMITVYILKVLLFLLLLFPSLTAHTIRNIFFMSNICTAFKRDIEKCEFLNQNSWGECYISYFKNCQNYSDVTNKIISLKIF